MNFFDAFLATTRRGQLGKLAEELVLACHRKQSGQTYHSIYGRMWWAYPPVR